MLDDTFANTSIGEGRQIRIDKRKLHLLMNTNDRRRSPDTRRNKQPTSANRQHIDRRRSPDTHRRKPTIERKHDIGKGVRGMLTELGREIESQIYT